MDITAHIAVRGAAEAADWYARAFGFAEISRLPVPDGRLMSLVLRYGDSLVHLADEFPELGVVSPLTLGGTYGALQLATDDADALWARAVQAGGEVLQPLADAFWGERHGQLRDPYGHRWNVAQHVRDVPLDEQERAVAQLFS